MVVGWLYIRTGYCFLKQHVTAPSKISAIIKVSWHRTGNPFLYLLIRLSCTELVDLQSRMFPCKWHPNFHSKTFSEDFGDDWNAEWLLASVAVPEGFLVEAEGLEEDQIFRAVRPDLWEDHGFPCLFCGIGTVRFATLDIKSCRFS